MPSWIIHTAEYDVDTAALLRRRLLAAHAPFALGEAAMGCAVTIEGAKGAELLAEALCEVLCRDLLVFALSAMRTEPPFPWRKSARWCFPPPGLPGARRIPPS